MVLRFLKRDKFDDSFLVLFVFFSNMFIVPDIIVAHILGVVFLSSPFAGQVQVLSHAPNLRRIELDGCGTLDSTSPLLVTPRYAHATAEILRHG